jgi:hypothetical protein
MLGINAEGFESEWAIFDRESLGFANQSSNLVRPQANERVEGSAGTRVNPTTGVGMQQTIFEERGTESGPGFAMASGAESDGVWLSTGSDQYSDAWQSTLFRLFGNTEFPPADDGLG